MILWHTQWPIIVCSRVPRASDWLPCTEPCGLVGWEPSLQLHRISKSLSDAHWPIGSQRAEAALPTSVTGFVGNNKVKVVTIKEKEEAIWASFSSQTSKNGCGGTFGSNRVRWDFFSCIDYSPEPCLKKGWKCMNSNKTLGFHSTGHTEKGCVCTCLVNTLVWTQRHQSEK